MLHPLFHTHPVSYCCVVCVHCCLLFSRATVVWCVKWCACHCSPSSSSSCFNSVFMICVYSLITHRMSELKWLNMLSINNITWITYCTKTVVLTYSHVPVTTQLRKIHKPKLCQN
uniref:Secreted protein n=1 Tax=Sipha flava TaxID=143950 RepID=A0A2S2PZN8_9HEMI